MLSKMHERLAMEEEIEEITEEEDKEGGVEIIKGKATKLIKDAIKQSGISQAAVAKKMGWVPQQLSARLVRNSTNADEFIAILGAIGFDVSIAEKGTGDFLAVPGHGRRVKQMVDHVVYDTAKACAMSNTFFADGKNEYAPDGKASELYLDKQGRYFVAEYSNWAGVKDRIVPVTIETAMEFMKRNGMGTNKDKS